MKTNSVLEEVSRVLTLEGQAILQCASRLSTPEQTQAWTGAVQAMSAALEQGGKIIVTGVGKSGKVGQKIAATFSSTGSMAVFLHPTEGLHGDLGLVSGRDVVLALSHSGNSEELINLLPSFQKLGVTLIGIGGNPKSQLAQESQFWLDGQITQEACPHNLAPTTSTTLALAMGDALAVALMQVRGFNADHFAQNHPGGSLGRRLKLKVKDLMVQGDALPLLEAHHSMAEVIQEISKKGLGAVLICKDRKLLGMITDGDLRRALSKGEAFFNLKAAEIMTQTPVTITPESSAWNAFELMENRKTKIKEIPVVSPDGNVEGLVQLFDLVQVF